MTEEIRTQSPEALEKERVIRRRKELSFELAESKEVFVFPGLKTGALEKLREAEKLVPEGYVTPIDELLRIFETEGFIIERGQQLIVTEKLSTIVTIAPAVTGPGFYGENQLHIKNLVTKGEDPRLDELITLAAV